MHLWLKDNLPLTTVTIGYQGASIDISDVLVDTGSGATVISVDFSSRIGIVPCGNDTLCTIRGVGGSEVVFVRRVDFLRVGEKSVADFEIEVGGMDYGFAINGILGMDFLIAAGTVINLHEMKIEFPVLCT
jgi:predicted aspartyl protease